MTSETCFTDDEAKTQSVFIADVIFALGTPVVCRGVEDSNLEGGLGDIRSYDAKSKCYTIHWADETLEPCAVCRRSIMIPQCVCLACMETDPILMEKSKIGLF